MRLWGLSSTSTRVFWHPLNFLGSLPGFVYLADIFTDFQNPVRTVNDQRDSSSETGNSFKALSAAGINNNNIAIHNIFTHMYDHPAVLPAPLYSYYHHLERTKVANSSEAQSELQHSGNNPWTRWGKWLQQPQQQVNASNMDRWQSPTHQHWVIGEKISTTPAQEDMDTGRESLLRRKCDLTQMWTAKLTKNSTGKKIKMYSNAVFCSTHRAQALGHHHCYCQQPLFHRQTLHNPARPTLILLTNHNPAL